MHSIVAIFTMLAILVAVGPAHAQQTTPQPPQPVTPTAGPPGTRFQFFASGFGARERLGFWLNRPDGVIVPFAPDLSGQRRASAAGLADWNWTAPANAATGTWTMVVRGVSTGNQVVLPVMISTPPPVAPGATVQPTEGAAGTRFVFSALGFAPFETISFFLTDPAGRAGKIEVVSSRSDTDRVDWAWLSAVDAAAGSWTMIARGDTSGTERAIVFRILASAAQPVGVTPREDRPGALFIFYATGFAEVENLVFWINTPDKRALPVTVERYVIAAGRADWSWQAPLDLAPGAYQMVVRGRTTGSERVVPFAIRTS